MRFIISALNTLILSPSKDEQPPSGGRPMIGALLLLLLLTGPAWAGDYALAPERIADGVYVLWGRQELMTADNGANICNTAFIVGADSVLVVDAGPSAAYAEQFLAAIARVTDKPVSHVVITHHHQDHAFGLGAFNARGARTLMSPNAAALLQRDGAALLTMTANRVGADWMAGTALARPTDLIPAPRVIDLGGRLVHVRPLEYGHTPGDLMVMDGATGTLLAGDLVFIERAATVPHADIPTWLGHIDTIAALDWRRLVPGHGPLITDRARLDPLRDYLSYLDEVSRASHARGDSPAETLMEPLPARFATLAVIEREFQRSILSLFAKYDRGG